MAPAGQIGLTGVLQPVRGVRLGAVPAGIRKPGKLDLVLIEVDPQTRCAAMFTRNAFRAAPVVLAQQHLARKAPRYLLINAGNANAGTGSKGLQAAADCCAAVAELGGCGRDEVLPFSTGVIGEPLPVERIRSALDSLFDGLGTDRWLDAAHGIMTTDTVAKAFSRQVGLDGHTATLNGIAKGAGMIHPDMATMLAFIATDARIEQGLLQRCLERAVAESFHCITIDGDTSTNDACVLLATGGLAMTSIDSERDPRYPAFEEAVFGICTTLAQSVVRDGEGATRFITVEVEEGRSREECRQVAQAVALSPLVKTAFFAGDPNWGRILAAVGRSAIPELDVGGVSIWLDELCIVRGGERSDAYLDELGHEIMQRTDITIRIGLSRGTSRARIWTTDLSYDYVRINAEYRT